MCWRSRRAWRCNCLFRKHEGRPVSSAQRSSCCLCRFLVHFISGVTIYRIYEPTELFNTTIYTNPWLYSAVYNGSYVLIDLVLCLVITALLYRPLSRYFAPQESGRGGKEKSGTELKAAPRNCVCAALPQKSKRAGIPLPADRLSGEPFQTERLSCFL